MFKLILLALTAFVVGACIYEAAGVYSYANDLSAARDALERARARISVWQVGNESAADVSSIQADLVDARQHLVSARDRMADDPGLELAKLFPDAEAQIEAFEQLVETTTLLAL